MIDQPIGSSFVALSRRDANKGTGKHPYSKREGRLTSSLLPSHLNSSPFSLLPRPLMAYLFTRIPLVNATQPFVGGSGVFEVTKGRTGDTAGGKAFAFDINVACGSSAKTTTATTIKRSIVSIHIFNVGNRSRYPNNSILFASGLVVFGTSTQAMSFHADASDIRKLAKGESIEDLGTMFCQYIGTAQKYLERPMPGGGIDGLLEVGLPLQDATAKFKT